MHRHSCAQSSSPLPFAPVSRQLSLPSPPSPVITACHGPLRPNAGGVMAPDVCAGNLFVGTEGGTAALFIAQRLVAANASAVPRCTNLCESREWERGGGVSVQSL